MAGMTEDEAKRAMAERSALLEKLPKGKKTENQAKTSNLLKCPDCGKDVSRRSTSCLNCGCPIEAVLADQEKVKDQIENEPKIKITEKIYDGPKCPKCRSTQISSGQQGFGLGKAAVGGLAVGPLGLAAGMIGKNNVMLNCMSCGHRWKPQPYKPPPPKPGSFEETAGYIFSGIIFLILLSLYMCGRSVR